MRHGLEDSLEYSRPPMRSLFRNKRGAHKVVVVVVFVSGAGPEATSLNFLGGVWVRVQEGRARSMVVGMLLYLL